MELAAPARGAAGWFTLTFLSGLTLIVVPVVLALLLTALLHRPVAQLRRVLSRAVAALGARCSSRW